MITVGDHTPSTPYTYTRYHALLENALPAFRASLEYGLLQDKSLSSVWFTFRREIDKESSPAFPELLQLFYQNVWLDVPSMAAWGATRPPAYFPKAIIVTRPPPYFIPGAGSGGFVWAASSGTSSHHLLCTQTGHRLSWPCVNTPPN